MPLGGFIDTALHFVGEIPQKPQFWGVNGRFQAKRAKYWKFHVIETTASISTKFCEDRSNRYGDIAIFVIFKMAAAAILNFQKFKILTIGPL